MTDSLIIWLLAKSNVNENTWLSSVENDFMDKIRRISTKHHTCLRRT